VSVRDNILVPGVADARAEGLLIIDFPGRKLAIYANPCGQIVLRSWEDGEEHATILEPSDAAPVCAAITAAASEAAATERSLMGDYKRHAAQGSVVHLSDFRPRG